MTHEQKLQELTADIREKLPRLNKPEEGDLIFYKGDVFNLHFTPDSEDADLELQHVCGEWIDFLEDDFNEHIRVGEMMLICSPMLNDVLEWLHGFLGGIINDIYWIYNFTINCKGEFRCGYFQDGFMGYWDLSEPYLRDQSEELIDFLYNLIEI